MNRTVRIATLLLVAMVAVGFTAPAAGLGVSADTVVSDDGDVEIDSDIQNADGTIDVVVRLEDADGPVVMAEGVQALKEHAEATQGAIVSYAQSNTGVEVVNTFWITNAVVLEVDTDVVDVTELASMDAVEELHANFTVKIPDAPESESTTAVDAQQAGYETTYGLAQINAPNVWDQFGTKGDGAKIAVLDTGVDPDHPDIDLYTEDPNDPTYPGGFTEIDSEGNPDDSVEPYDSDTHGTHVSGTVSGGDASGEYIGVAPNVDLMHGLVLNGGSGSWAQIIGGMEWAVNNGADAISMSLGANGYHDQFVDPIQNAQDAGTIVISAAGNDGEGETGSPGNLYDGMAIGATDSNADVTSFSGGEEIITQDAWGDSAPAHWPDKYIVPDVAAPGNDVKSSVPGGGYDEYPGTSMATPHVSGVVALMVSANPDLTPSQIEQTLVDTAWKPDGEADGQDVRYGHGIVDAEAAVSQVAMDTGATGTVVSDGEPVAGADVTLDGLTATTDANGEFSIVTEPGTYDLTVSGDGVETTTVTVTVEDSGQYTDVGSISVPPELYGEVTEDQPEAVEAGENVTATLSVKNVELASISMSGTYDQSDANLLIAGQNAEFDTTYDLGGYSGDIDVTVETDASATGEFSLEYTAEGYGDTDQLSSGPTEVVDDLILVGLVGGDYLGDIEATLSEQLPSHVQYEVVDSADAASGYDALVVQSLAGVDSQAFVDATSGSDVGVVYLDQWGTTADAISQFGNLTGAVSGTQQDDSYSGDATGPIYYEPTAEHEILDGISGEVQIHDGQYADVTWFESTSYDVISNVNDADGPKGSALAVDESSNTVLGSSLGYTQWVATDQYSDTADQILANSVAFAAGMSSGDDPAPAEFVIDSTDAPASGETGEDVTVTATVSNVGDEAGDTTVGLTLAGETVDSTTVSLAGGETTTVDLRATLPQSAGTYDWTVATSDDSASGQIDVEDGSTGSVVLDLEETTAEPGGTATADLTATGDGVAGYEAMIGFDPSVVQVDTVSGVDFADPEINVDQDNGLVKIAQAQETGVADPTLATITFDVVADGNASTQLPLFADETSVNDAQGEDFTLELDDGAVTVEQSTDCQLGDVDGDGEVSPADATLTQRHIVGLEIDGEFHTECADVNEDGEINTGDVVAILQHVVDFSA